MAGKKKKNNMQTKLRNFIAKQRGAMAKIARATKKRQDQMRKIMKQQ